MLFIFLCVLFVQYTQCKIDKKWLSPPTPSANLPADIGVEYIVQKKGDCKKGAARQLTRIKMHYSGWLLKDGSEFDSSFKRGEPLSFTIGTGQVIPGWEQGSLDMCVGERRTVVIPSGSGYGENGIGPIPGGATLVFDVELVSVESGAAEWEPHDGADL